MIGRAINNTKHQRSAKKYERYHHIVAATYPTRPRPRCKGFYVIKALHNISRHPTDPRYPSHRVHVLVLSPPDLAFKKRGLAKIRGQFWVKISYTQKTNTNHTPGPLLLARLTYYLILARKYQGIPDSVYCLAFN